MTRIILLASAVILLAPAPRAGAHDFTPGVLSLVEVSPGSFRHVWTAPVDSQTPLQVDVRFPPQCEREGDLLSCGPEGLHGEIAFPGMGDPRVRVVVTVIRLQGAPLEAIVDGGSPRLSLQEPPGSSLLAWVRTGAEHVLLGLDHLAFLLGLLLVTGIDRRILATVTAFTVAHSLTLALASLGVLRLASAPVEATIAASVVLVAREALHREPTLTRRLPWVVAACFGLVHGLGFAGALSDIGLPEQSAGWALLWFNVGVELGQLAVVGLFAFVAWQGARWPRLALARPALCYALGALGVWWLIGRAVPLVTGLPW